jgi:alpha-amylase/alpha-mannosidase (GH57 family)
MARLTFLWHLHQPPYRTADGRVHAPWVLLHAGGEYLTLAHALSRSSWRGHVLNLSPTLLEQLRAYRDGKARDPLLSALSTPAHDLEPDGQRELLSWAFLMHPRQLQRWPRLAELAARAADVSSGEPAHRFTAQELCDIQTLLVLAYAGPNLVWEEELAELAVLDRSFSEQARASAVRWLAACPGRLLEIYEKLARRPGIEVSTSPYAHPIVPLLIDTAIAHDALAPHTGPEVPDFAAPEDAAKQIEHGLEALRAWGFAPVGCWPPEGAVSETAVALFGRRGVQWLATDEAILARSLGHQLTGETGVGAELFYPWRVRDDGPLLFFRHRGWSDYLSFQAGRDADELRAATHLAGGLRALARRLPTDAGIVIAVDGENPWTGFPHGGARFLPALAHELEQAPELVPATLAERCASEQPRRLERLHPGSWIGGTFATWIGHPEKNRAWELLARVRALGIDTTSDSWLAAEASDWWWWLGDDHPTALAPLYDRILRLHLADACARTGVLPPAELSAPLRSASVPLRVPRSQRWPVPVLDGQTTSYFEWSLATCVEAPATHKKIARVALRASADRLWLRLDGPEGQPAPVPLVLTLVSGGTPHSWAVPAELPHDSAVARCVEITVELPPSGALLALGCGGERMPVEGFWRLDIEDVDQ